LEDAGIPAALITDLVVRRVYLDGVSSLFGLTESLKLPHRIIEQVFAHLRQQQLIDVKSVVGEDYTFSLTNAGQRLAFNRRRITHYAGPAPVSIRDYERAVRQQAAKLKLDRASLSKAFSDLVVTDKLLSQLGPALVSQKSLFLYGPTGNGKTSLAERLQRVFHDCILMPYALAVDSQIIVVYDPVVHECSGELPQGIDPRWVLCKRPLIVVGGELTPAMLELRIDTASQIYAAPVQMKANNGILVIDDFGRQVISPRKLLNRWILPLDRRVDYLNLKYGVKFQIPFETMVVFSTNLEPRELADEAFLRRIHNKIYVEPVSAEVFDKIFDRILLEKRIPYEPGTSEYLRKLCEKAGSGELRACFPGDIFTIIRWIKDFEGEPMAVRRGDLERAVALYFTRTNDAAGALPRSPDL
jgi:MoxR-like ATPase